MKYLDNEFEAEIQSQIESMNSDESFKSLSKIGFLSL